MFLEIVDRLYMVASIRVQGFLVINPQTSALSGGVVGEY